MNHFRYGSEFRTPPHMHDEYAIVALSEGITDYTQFETCERLHRGDLLVTNAATLHSSIHASGGLRTEGIAVTLSGAAFHDLLSRAGVPLPQPSRQCVLMHKLTLPAALPLLDALVQEAANSGPSSDAVMEGIAIAFCLQALRAWPRALIRERAAASTE